MSVTTIEGVVENGRIRLTQNVSLPERAKVYVIIPGLSMSPASLLASPRLARPEQAKDFTEALIDSPDAKL